MFLNTADMVDGEELRGLEVRELLSKCDIRGDDTPIIKGSAKLALEDDEGPLGKRAIASLTLAQV